MNINYQNATISIIYNGKKTDLYTDVLNKIDEKTSKHLTKFTLMKELINSPSINNQTKKMLELIEEEMPYDYTDNDDYDKFNFIVTTKNDSTTIILPTMYGAYIEKENYLSDCLKNNDKLLIPILKTYNNMIETDQNNSNIISEIEKYHKYILNENLLDDLILLNDFETQNDKTKKGKEYYSKLKATYDALNERNGLISKLVSKTQNSYYKKRSLYSIMQLYNGELSEFEKLIVTEKDKSYNNLENILFEKTEEKKQVK